MNTPNKQSNTRQSQREAAREAARQMREKGAKKAKKRKILVQTSIITGLVAIGVVVALVIFNSNPTTGPTAFPKNMQSGGIVFTGSQTAKLTDAATAEGDFVSHPTDPSGSVTHIQVWLDYQCPWCAKFEEANMEYTKKLLDEGTATLEIFPVAILDSKANDDFSTRAAASTACVANYEPNLFLDANFALFQNQPSESDGATKTTPEILSIIQGAGATSSEIEACVTDQRFAQFVTESTKAATSAEALRTERGFSVPAVFANGERYAGNLTDSAQFTAFIESVSAESKQ